MTQQTVPLSPQYADEYAAKIIEEKKGKLK